MDAEQKRARWPIVAVLLLGLLLLPVLYALSIGPAYWLMQHNRISIDAYASFYSPLAPLADFYPPFDNFLEWYLPLFVATP